MVEVFRSTKSRSIIVHCVIEALSALRSGRMARRDVAIAAHHEDCWEGGVLCPFATRNGPAHLPPPPVLLALLVINLKNYNTSIPVKLHFS